MTVYMYIPNSVILISSVIKGLHNSTKLSYIYYSKLLWITNLHLTTLITSPINFVLYFKNWKSIQHEILTIAKSFIETNNHVKMIDKYFVAFKSAYIRL